MARDEDDIFGDDEPSELQDSDSDLTIQDKHGLSLLTGLLIKDIEKLLREGLPVHGRRTKGRAVQFNVPIVIQWLLQRSGGNIETAKRRREEATARKREAEANNLEGTHVPITLVEDMIQNQMAELRSGFLSIPARVPSGARALVQREIESTINRFSIELPK